MALKKETVTADEHKLRHAIINILSNAVKFTPKGGKFAVGLEKEKGNVSISVTDSGIGIEGAKLDKIFKEFYQVSNAYHNKTPVHQASKN